VRNETHTFGGSPPSSSPARPINQSIAPSPADNFQQQNSIVSVTSRFSVDSYSSGHLHALLTLTQLEPSCGGHARATQNIPRWAKERIACFSGLERIST
jgi:hypothetical protein